MPSSQIHVLNTGTGVAPEEKSTGTDLVERGLYLNLGSGQRPFEKPWTNVDTQQRWNPDIMMPAEEYLKYLLCPLEGEKLPVKMICLHHVLEHYGCGEAEELLRLCHEVLKPRGSLLVFVPNMWALTTMWRAGELDDQVYLTNIYGAYMGHEADRHKWGFTKQSLFYTLDAIGFTVNLFDWRSIPGADIARDKWIIGMEAVKV